MVVVNHALLMKEAEGAELSDHVEGIAGMASMALSDVRQISRGLRPYQIDQVGLSETLRSTLRTVAESAPFRLTIEIEEIDGLLGREEEISLYRLVQESVTNILKHARANEAAVRIWREEDRLRISVTDDGAGFDSELIKVPGASGGLGIRSMTERVWMLGGTMNIDTAPGRGTRIEVMVPVGGGMVKGEK